MTRVTLALLIMTTTAIGIRAQAPTPPTLVFAFELHAEVAPPLVVGDIAAGTRRIVQITGGTFEGPGFKGRVLPGGADWQVIHADGFTELDTRYTIQTDTGKTVYVQNAGIRHAAPDVMKQLLAGQPVDPALVYFRTVAQVRNLRAGAAVAHARSLHRCWPAQSIGRADPLLARRVTAAAEAFVSPALDGSEAGRQDCGSCVRGRRTPGTGCSDRAPWRAGASRPHRQTGPPAPRRLKRPHRPHRRRLGPPHRDREPSAADVSSRDLGYAPPPAAVRSHRNSISSIDSFEPGTWRPAYRYRRSAAAPAGPCRCDRW